MSHSSPSIEKTEGRQGAGRDGIALMFELDRKASTIILRATRR
jgi:hypothetical protein